MEASLLALAKSIYYQNGLNVWTWCFTQTHRKNHLIESAISVTQKNVGRTFYRTECLSEDQEEDPASSKGRFKCVFDRILWCDHIQKTVAELGQSVEHLIVEREVAGSIPETETTLRVL